MVNYTCEYKQIHRHVQHDAIEGVPVEVVSPPVLSYKTKQQEYVITYDFIPTQITWLIIHMDIDIYGYIYIYSTIPSKEYQ